MKINPEAFRKVLNWVNKEFNPGEIYVTENGFGDTVGNLDDLHRIYYLKHYTNSMLKGELKLI